MLAADKFILQVLRFFAGLIDEFPQLRAQKYLAKRNFADHFWQLGHFFFQFRFKQGQIDAQSLQNGNNDAFGLPNKSQDQMQNVYLLLSAFRG